MIPVLISLVCILYIMGTMRLYMGDMSPLNFMMSILLGILLPFGLAVCTVLNVSMLYTWLRVRKWQK